MRLVTVLIPLNCGVVLPDEAHFCERHLPPRSASSGLFGNSVAGYDSFPTALIGVMVSCCFAVGAAAALFCVYAPLYFVCVRVRRRRGSGAHIKHTLRTFPRRFISGYNRFANVSPPHKSNYTNADGNTKKKTAVPRQPKLLE